MKPRVRGFFCPQILTITRERVVVVIFLKRLPCGAFGANKHFLRHTFRVTFFETLNGYGGAVRNALKSVELIPSFVKMIER